MKKTVIALIGLVMLNLVATAQKPTIGFAGGVTISNMRAESGGEEDSGESKLGGTLGVVANIKAGKNFIFQPALNWVQKGTKDEEEISGSEYKVKLVNNYLEIPLNFLFHNGRFFAGAGPSIAFAISGRATVEIDGDEESESINFGSGEDDDMKGLDVGANVLAGYQFPSGFFIAANFNKGFSNLLIDDSDDSSLKTHYFGIKIGYMLKAIKK